MLRAAGLYAILTVVFTWPMAARLRIMDAGALCEVACLGGDRVFERQSPSEGSR